MKRDPAQPWLIIGIIGICAQYMLDRRTCPIHGDTKEYKQPN